MIAWLPDAPCGTSTVDFTGDDPNPAALAICLDCPLAKTCRNLAQTDRHATGVYGATWIVNGRTKRIGKKCERCASPFFVELHRISQRFCRRECFVGAGAAA